MFKCVSGVARQRHMRGIRSQSWKHGYRVAVAETHGQSRVIYRTFSSFQDTGKIMVGRGKTSAAT